MKRETLKLNLTAVSYELKPQPESKKRIRRKLKALHRKKASIDKTIEVLSRK